jgi:predicted CXXCH cytochrome family protein
VQKHTNPLTRLQSRADDTPDATIINPAKVSAQISSEICGQCHTEFDPVDEKQFYTHGLPYRAGGNLQASHRIFRYAEITRNENDSENAMFCRTHGFWDDGTIRSGGDEYLGLLESPCYQRGTGTRQLSCLSCHQMHGSDPNDQLKETMSGNEACLQCHDQFRKRLEQHTHHPPSSAGSLCYNCHMPHTTYALFTAMRSHRIVVPKVVVGKLSGRPNACNLCHLDQTLDWTAKQLNRWYDTPIGKEAGHTVGHDDDIPASVRWVLSGDAAQRLIVAWHMGWEPALKVSGDRWQSPLLSELLIDPYSVVRHVAHRSLRSHPDFKDFEYDFIAPPAQRRETRDRAIAIWNGVVHRSPVQQLDAVFDVDGKLKLGVVKKLMEQRDEREVFLPE